MVRWPRRHFARPPQSALQDHLIGPVALSLLVSNARNRPAEKSNCAASGVVTSGLRWVQSLILLLSVRISQQFKNLLPRPSLVWGR